MKDRVETITSIVCSSYQPSGSTSPEAIVGICVFTGSGKPILKKSADKCDPSNASGDSLDKTYLRVLQERTRKFYDDFHIDIEDKRVTALADRKKRRLF
jgi:hypothetical protein